LNLLRSAPVIPHTGWIGLPFGLHTPLPHLCPVYRTPHTLVTHLWIWIAVTYTLPWFVGCCPICPLDRIADCLGWDYNTLPWIWLDLWVYLWLVYPQFTFYGIALVGRCVWTLVGWICPVGYLWLLPVGWLDLHTLYPLPHTRTDLPLDLVVPRCPVG